LAPEEPVNREAEHVAKDLLPDIDQDTLALVVPVAIAFNAGYEVGYKGALRMVFAAQVADRDLICETARTVATQLLSEQSGPRP
jgi:hypothetical protein